MSAKANGAAVDEPFRVLVDARPPAADAPSSAPAAGPPRVTRREAWVALPAPYEGFEFRLHLNVSTKTLKAVQAELAAGETAALHRVVIAHNGWLDEEGQPYPPADDPGLWDEIPQDLAVMTIAAVVQELGNLGNSLAPTGRR